MSREAIESFVEEIRRELPKLRRSWAFLHACSEDRDVQNESRRLTKSLRTAANLTGSTTLAHIIAHQERLLDELVNQRLVMHDRLRDTLERITDVIEAYADGLQSGSVPERQLLGEVRSLFRRHISDELPFTPAEPTSVSDEPAAMSLVETPPVPSTEAAEVPLGDLPDRVVSQFVEPLQVVAEMLGVFRDDPSRWDLLADIRRRIHAIKDMSRESSLTDFSELAHASELLLQRVLDRSTPPTESVIDSLQASVDALEELLTRPLDESLSHALFDRLQCLSDGSSKVNSSGEEPRDEPETSVSVVDTAAAEDASSLAVTESEEEPRCAVAFMEEPPTTEVAVDERPHIQAIRQATDPMSIELDDREALSDDMLTVFTEEADDHLRAIQSAFAELEKHPDRWARIQDVRRAAHTIKGAAGAVRFRLVSKLAHRMEDLLDQLFESRQPLTASQLALLFDTVDTLQDLVHGEYSEQGIRTSVAQLFDSYDAAMADATSPPAHTTIPPEPAVVPPTPALLEPLPLDADSLENEKENEKGSGTFSDTRGFLTSFGTEESSDESEDATVIISLDDFVDDDAEPMFEPPTDDTPAEVAATFESAVVVEEARPTLAVGDRLAQPSSAVPIHAMDDSSTHAIKPTGESLRVPLSKVDSLMREVSELIVNRSAFEQRMQDFARCVEEIQRSVERMRTTTHNLDRQYGVDLLGGRRTLRGDGASLWPSRGSSDRPHHDEFDPLELDRYTEFHLFSRSLAETANDLGTVSGELRHLIGDFDHLLNRQGRLSRDTQDRLMRIRMVPLGTLATKLHRTVRVVANQLQKSVDFLLQGGDVELDKSVLEELADPLMHILRNAVDHGIESEVVRVAAGKPQRATVSVQAFAQGTQVIIRVRDDGRGLDFEAIRATAIRNGVVSADDAQDLREDELAAFLFRPGFSTARELSEISGRGVGMDIVRDTVQKLKGSVRIESESGQGTTLTIRLPMTLAVMRALLVQSANETFALPLSSVEQILRLNSSELEQLGENQIVRVGDEAISFVTLADRLRQHSANIAPASHLPVLIVASDDHKVAVGVEKIVASRDIVVKSLGSHLRHVPGFLGATLMGDGSVVPILDAAALVGQCGTVTRNNTITATPARSEEERTPTIMVVDDSVSVRRIMTNLLTKNGWRVLDAKDGVDALEKLQHTEHQPDLFLLDVEMPRMDGYELLTSLRSHFEHRETPIVMVTSRAGDKHRQKALQLGATDYVIKPYQDAELLSLIRRNLNQLVLCGTADSELPI